MYLKSQIFLFFSEALSMYQCKINLQANKIKKKYLQNKRNNCQEQNIIVSLQKKIARKINETNTV